MRNLGNALLVRYSEIAVKGHMTRRRMEVLLADAVAEALKRRGVRYDRIERIPGRIVVWNPSAAESDIVVSKVFGVKSVSRAVAIEFNKKEDIIDYGIRLFSEKVKNRIFRVRARRTGQHDFTSKDIEKELGAALLRSGAKGVNLEEPEVTVYVEVRDNIAFYYTDIVRGPGGLPIGSEEPMLVLYSGGFDSTVAAWLAMRRGSPVGLAFYSLGLDPARKIAVEAAKYLNEEWVYYGNIKMFIIDFSRVVGAVRRVVDPGYILLVMRRLMMEHACELALDNGYEALVTGESIGQVASQTVRNIRLIGSNLCLPVIRPVSGMDKDEVMALARDIGVYDIVSRQVEQCRGNPIPRASPRVFATMLDRAKKALDKVEIKVSVVDL